MVVMRRFPFLPSLQGLSCVWGSDSLRRVTRRVEPSIEERMSWLGYRFFIAATTSVTWWIGWAAWLFYTWWTWKFIPESYENWFGDMDHLSSSVGRFTITLLFAGFGVFLFWVMSLFFKSGNRFWSPLVLPLVGAVIGDCAGWPLAFLMTKASGADLWYLVVPAMAGAAQGLLAALLNCRWRRRPSA